MFALLCVWVESSGKLILYLSFCVYTDASEDAIHAFKSDYAGVHTIRTCTHARMYKNRQTLLQLDCKGPTKYG